MNENERRATPPSPSTAPIPEDERAVFEAWAEQSAIRTDLGAWDAWQARADIASRAASPLSSEQQADVEEIASVIEGALVDDLLPHHSCEWVERARSAIAQLRGTRKETPCGS